MPNEFSEELYVQVKSNPSSWSAREITKLRKQVRELQKDKDDLIQENNRAWHRNNARDMPNRGVEGG